MKFADLLGNKPVVHRLRRYLEEDRIPDSMIFAGPPSAAPLQFAQAWARGCNCLSFTRDSCGTCRPCIEIEAGIFPDFTVLQPDGQHYKKEQIVNLVESNSFRPLVGRRKITVLCDAHHMNDSASNAFLKVLEEPSSDHGFILITSNIHGLLPTIRSRCHILTFSSLPQVEVQRILEKKGLPTQQARLLSFVNPDGAVSFQKSQLNKFMERREAALALLMALVTDRGSEQPLVALETLSGNRQKFIEHFTEQIHLISLFLRDIMVLQIDSDSQYVVNIDLREALNQVAQRMMPDRTLSLLRSMERLLRDVMRNLNTRVLIQELIRTVSWGEVMHG
jgi:DNA polymerase-3 subunit delta'